MESVLKVSGNQKSDILVVSFAGHDVMFGGTPKLEFVNNFAFEFVNFFAKHFSDIDQHFYIDKNKTSYHKGIDGKTNCVEETVTFLKNEIQNYKKVIFIGVSSGGYAAILFGSLLNVSQVIAFIPQTIRRDKKIDEKYRDVSPFINDTTQYHLYGNLSILDKNDPHHISHCERISHHRNVFVNTIERFNLKQLRESGKLLTMLNNIIRDPPSIALIPA